MLSKPGSPSPVGHIRLPGSGAEPGHDAGAVGRGGREGTPMNRDAAVNRAGLE